MGVKFALRTGKQKTIYIPVDRLRVADEVQLHEVVERDPGVPGIRMTNRVPTPRRLSA